MKSMKQKKSSGLPLKKGEKTVLMTFKAPLSFRSAFSERARGEATTPSKALQAFIRSFIKGTPIDFQGSFETKAKK